ncbi:MAG: sugar ABC transporter ATP-binding protein [Lachnospiraceae bacterium]|nr:sugar ABC transporter ATP-binding protein [Lachnospiraceae bacterium]
MEDIILKVQDITKIYPGVRALDGVSFEVRRGEVHAICGENGAGKSTLIKVLTGAIEPTSGTIEFKGKTYEKLNPKLSMELGISVIYQEFSLIPYLTVAENIFYGREIRKGVVRDIKAMEEKARELCQDMGVELDVHKRVCDLGVAYQQIVEILKAVSRNTEFIIMDEPTAPLTLKETEVFFKIIDRLKKENVTIIFISHRLEEVFELCDRVTVFCDGKYVLTKDVKDMDRKSLIASMVGRELSDDYPVPNREIGEPVMEVRGLTNKNVKDVSFEIKKGEILGFGGLVGAGRTELARALYGADPIQSGEIVLKDKKYVPKNPRTGLDAGIGLIPEDRKAQGVVLSRPIRENIVYSILKRITKVSFIDRKKEKEYSSRYIEDLNIKTPSADQLVQNLSGGNQQKVVLAKAMATDCDILIFDEPTRGIDVGAKQEIYALMCKLVEAGKSVIMISSEMPELLGMSDRIIVMSNGRIAGVLDRSEYSQAKVLEMASSQL